MGIITDILKEIPLSAVLREKIVGLESKMSILESENLILKTELEKSKSTIEQQSKKIQTLEEVSHIPPLNEKYDFIKELGIYKSKESGHYFCTSCLMNNIESPLTEKQNGWQCELKDCNKFYTNPLYRPQQREKTYDPFERP